MAEAESFKQKILKRTYLYSIKLIQFVDELDQKKLSRSIIAKQLMRSGTSIGANLVEAQGSPSKRDFVNYLSTSLKSANETKYWLGLIRDTQDPPDKKAAEVLLKETEEIAKILGSSIATIKGTKTQNHF